MGDYPLRWSDLEPGKTYAIHVMDCCVTVEFTRLLIAKTNDEAETDPLLVFEGGIKVEGYSVVGREVE